MTDHIRSEPSRLRREQNIWGRERRRERRTGQYLFKTLLSHRGASWWRNITDTSLWKDEVEGYLHETHSNTLRCPNEVKVDPPEALMDVREHNCKELKEVVKKARSASASPGPIGIPCFVYKRCPMLLRKIWQLFRVIWRKEIIPKCWKEAEGCFVPKEKKTRWQSTSSGQNISLLNVEVKMNIFWVYGEEQLHRYRRQAYQGSPNA